MGEGEYVSVELDDEQFEALREFVAEKPDWVAPLASAKRKRHVRVVRADYVSLQWLAQDITHALVHGEDRDDAEALESVAVSIEQVLGLD